MSKIRRFINEVPGLNLLAKKIYFGLIQPRMQFKGSQAYWERRYRDGGDSGCGSMGELAHFKADYINSFVHDNSVVSVIELGCGDGMQLSLAEYPSYVGYDISEEAVARCQQSFSQDSTKRFIAGNCDTDVAELAISLDVIYHLVEDDIYLGYLERLFNAGTRYVIVFSSNTSTQADYQGLHIRHRAFLDDVLQRFKEWRLIHVEKNPYEYSGNDKTGSFADFYVFSRGTGG